MDTHVFVSPQMERRLCCASLETAENFKQYIDTFGPNKDELNLIKKKIIGIQII